MSKKHLVSFLLLDENFHGAIEAKLDNWTGLAYRIPRDRIAAYAERKVLSYSGVYLLFGKDDKTGEDAVYIGQAQERLAGGSILNRLSEHNRNPEKAFYSEVVFFTSATNSFGPTELCYLENRFYQMAKDANRFVVKNREVPSPGNVTEAKEVELDRYIENAALLVQGFGYRVLSLRLRVNVLQRLSDSVFLKCLRSEETKEQNLQRSRNKRLLRSNTRPILKRTLFPLFLKKGKRICLDFSSLVSFKRNIGCGEKRYGMGRALLFRKEV